MLKNALFFLLTFFVWNEACIAQWGGRGRIRTGVPTDSIRLSDPFVLADEATQTYYMTGTGGQLWKSRDLKRWDGPLTVAETTADSWMGARPMIWAAELHKYNGKYYYFLQQLYRLRTAHQGESACDRGGSHPEGAFTLWQHEAD